MDALTEYKFWLNSDGFFMFPDLKALFNFTKKYFVKNTSKSHMYSIKITKKNLKAKSKEI